MEKGVDRNTIIRETKTKSYNLLKNIFINDNR